MPSHLAVLASQLLGKATAQTLHAMAVVELKIVQQALSAPWEEGLGWEQLLEQLPVLQQEQGPESR
jgi:hypothetical protein